MSVYSELKKKIKNKKAIIAVVGLGYVGLPMALGFAKKGFTVIGIDASKKRINRLKKAITYISDIKEEEIKKALKTKRFNPTADKRVLKNADTVIICVPTPLSDKHKPDVSFILSASETVGKNMKEGTLIVLESTTYPGTTKELVLPVLEKNSKMICGKDFHLAFSPERIDPGNKKYNFTNITKLVGGHTKNSTELAKILYSNVVKKVKGLSSTEVAEVTKLLENTFRIVNIGLINEFARLCDKLGIDVWEVIEAAKTKPFGYMPFYPGPGVGGHCIPADPMYLSWKARKVGFATQMVDLAAKVNREAPKYVVDRVKKILKSEGVKFKDAKVLIVGVAYKKDVNDLRESPALDIIKLLDRESIKWAYVDPHITYLDIKGIKSKPVKISKTLLKKQDVTVIVTDHSNVNYKMIENNSKVVFDTRNILEKKGISGDNIVKL